MTTAQCEFEQPAPAVRVALDRRGAGRMNEGARVRLLLAVAGLAALVAWGALSHVGIATSADRSGATSAQDSLRYDGRGKWTGYASEWRSRPQIIRDAGHHAASLIQHGPGEAGRGRPQSTWISQVVR